MLSMSNERSVRLMSSRETRTPVRKILQNHDADTEFSVNMSNKIMRKGKQKKVILQDWGYGSEKTRKVKERLENLGLEVEFQY